MSEKTPEVKPDCVCQNMAAITKAARFDLQPEEGDPIPAWECPEHGKMAIGDFDPEYPGALCPLEVGHFPILEFCGRLLRLEKDGALYCETCDAFFLPEQIRPGRSQKDLEKAAKELAKRATEGKGFI